jgi:hypothetical protein
MRKNILIGLIIFAIISTAYTSGILEDSNDEEKWWDISEFHYEIEIAPNETGNYSILAPVPEISSNNNPRQGQPTNIIHKIELIGGNATWKLINQTGSYWLSITATDRFHIMGHVEFRNVTRSLYSDYLFKHVANGFFYNSSSSSSSRLNMSVYWKETRSRGGLERKFSVENFFFQPEENMGVDWYSVEWKKTDIIYD